MVYLKIYLLLLFSSDGRLFIQNMSDMDICCEFWPACACLQHPKAGRNTFFLLFLDLFLGFRIFLNLGMCSIVCHMERTEKNLARTKDMFINQRNLLQGHLPERGCERCKKVARRSNFGGKKSRSKLKLELRAERVQAQQLDDNSPSSFGGKTRHYRNLEHREENFNWSCKYF